MVFKSIIAEGLFADPFSKSYSAMPGSVKISRASAAVMGVGWLLIFADVETIKLLNVQKDATVKQLIKYPDLYYAKSSFPLEISQRAFDFLWRMCESYELWCKETGQSEQLLLGVTD